MKNFKSKSLIAGFLIWLFFTILFRLIGENIFLVSSNFIITLFFVAAPPLLYFIVTGIMNLIKVPKNKSVVSSALLAMPGMFFDTFFVLFFENLLPNISPEASNEFGSWLLWCYCMVIITGFIRSR